MNKCVRLGDNRRRWKKGRRGERGRGGGSAGPLTSDANRLQAIVAEREEGVNGLIYRSPRLTNFFCCLPRWEALCERSDGLSPCHPQTGFNFVRGGVAILPKRKITT